MSDTITNILMVGVGGQGIILASDILAESLMVAGFDVKKSEVHGMAQRGGSVTSHVRFGKKVYSPLIARGQTDILYCMEMLEALRSIDFLKPDSLIILNNYRLNPPSVSLGVDEYPEGIYETFQKYFSRVALLDGVGLAQKNGNPRTMGIIVLGYLSLYLDVPQEIWEAVIRRRVPKKVVDVNLSAFGIGRGVDRIR
ncbi:MAG: indolepyruvate oxidoreductase subunit beta [Candidatus Dadabacteria bacterium]|nr:indolepyruvate oxidoreductase subunit beta [Candidatus Dadabacteria bacterium]